jgi:hypothetical protein
MGFWWHLTPKQDQPGKKLQIPRLTLGMTKDTLAALIKSYGCID